jgi:Conserved hypothetical protein (DUF2461).
MPIPFPSTNQHLTTPHRANILRNPTRLRQVISDPEFVNNFGEAKPQSDGTRRNIFGLEDELKVAPKGIDKTHKYTAILSIYLHTDILT